MIETVGPDERSRDAYPQLARLSDLLDGLEADATAARQAYLTEGAYRGSITGLPKLDKALGGAMSPGLHTVHGSPGSGKSALLGQIAASSQCSALLVTCEMQAPELFLRHIARATGTPLQRLKSGELEPSEVMELARTAAQKAPAMAIVDGTQVWPSPDWLRQAADVVRGDSKYLLIGVDSIHAWADGSPGGAPEYERLGAAVDALRALSATLSCAVLAVAERNRASMDRGGSPPALDRGSSNTPPRVSGTCSESRTRSLMPRARCLSR